MHCTTISLQMRIGASGKTRQNRSRNHFGRFVGEQWEFEWIEIGRLWVHGGKTSRLIQQYVLPGTIIVSDCWSWVHGGKTSRLIQQYVLPGTIVVSDCWSWVHGGKTSRLIQQYVLPGTTIVSDCWRAYRTIGLLGNHQLNFVDPNLDVVDPITGASTNHVECYWKNAKMCDCGTAKTQLHSYLIEYMWRRQFGDNRSNSPRECVGSISNKLSGCRPIIMLN